MENTGKTLKQIFDSYGEEIAKLEQEFKEKSEELPYFSEEHNVIKEKYYSQEYLHEGSIIKIKKELYGGYSTYTSWNLADFNKYICNILRLTTGLNWLAVGSYIYPEEALYDNFLLVDHQNKRFDSRSNCISLNRGEDRDKEILSLGKFDKCVFNHYDFSGYYADRVRICNWDEKNSYKMKWITTEVFHNNKVINEAIWDVMEILLRERKSGVFDFNKISPFIDELYQKYSQITNEELINNSKFLIYIYTHSLGERRLNYVVRELNDIDIKLTHVSRLLHNGITALGDVNERLGIINGNNIEGFKSVKATLKEIRDIANDIKLGVNGCEVEGKRHRLSIL